MWNLRKSYKLLAIKLFFKLFNRANVIPLPWTIVFFLLSRSSGGHFNPTKRNLNEFIAYFFCLSLEQNTTILLLLFLLLSLGFSNIFHFVSFFVFHFYPPDRNINLLSYILLQNCDSTPDIISHLIPNHWKSLYVCLSCLSLYFRHWILYLKLYLFCSIYIA